MENDEDLSLFVLKHRSSNFKVEEIRTLLDLISKYKKFILNRCISKTANHKKELAWKKVTKLLNKSNVGIRRSTDNVKNKWLNIKRDLRKMSRRGLNNVEHENHDIYARIVDLMTESEINENFASDAEHSIDEMNGSDGDIDSVGYTNTKFTDQETKLLVNLIEQYKHVLLVNSTKLTEISKKEKAWDEITEKFNKTQDAKRSVENLQTNWEILKKSVKTTSGNLSLLKECDEINEKILNITMYELENEINCDESESNRDESTDEEVIKKQVNNKSYGTVKYEESDNESISEGDNSSTKRSTNFSFKECKLLMECVREHQEHIFSNSCTSLANSLKNKAWKKVIETFNKRTTESKRSGKVLRTKFSNMRRSSKLHKNYNTLNSKESIKMEPEFEYFEDKMDPADLEENNDEVLSELQLPINIEDTDCQDPLNTVLNSNIGNSNPWCQSENKQVVRMKLDLLKYQMETAKLERKRVEAAIEAEKEERKSRAVELALRLRAARLGALAAHAHHAPAAPELRYPPPEALARDYLLATPDDT